MAKRWGGGGFVVSSLCPWKLWVLKLYRSYSDRLRHLLIWVMAPIRNALVFKLYPKWRMPGGLWHLLMNRCPILIPHLRITDPSLSHRLIIIIKLSCCKRALILLILPSFLLYLSFRVFGLKLTNSINLFFALTWLLPLLNMLPLIRYDPWALLLVLLFLQKRYLVGTARRVNPGSWYLSNISYFLVTVITWDVATVLVFAYFLDCAEMLRMMGILMLGHGTPFRHNFRGYMLWIFNFLAIHRVFSWSLTLFIFQIVILNS